MSQVMSECIFEQVPDWCQFFRLSSPSEKPYGRCTAPRCHPLLSCFPNRHDSRLTEPGKDYIRKLFEDEIERS